MKLKIGLQVKSIIAISILIILVTFILSMFFIARDEDMVHRSLKEMGIVLATNLADNVEYGVLTGNSKELAKIVKAIMKQPQVSYCVIKDSRGKELVASGLANNTNLMLALADTERKVDNNADIRRIELMGGNNYYDIAVPIVTEIGKNIQEHELDDNKTRYEHNYRSSNNLRKIGSVRIGLSLASAAASVMDMQRTVVLISITIIIIAALFTTLLTGVAVSPIHNLVIATKKIASGDLNFEVPIQSSDELGQVAESFNKMTDDLRSFRDEFIKSKEYTDNIIKSMVDVLVVIDPKGKIRTVNPSAIKILGYGEDELIGKPIDIVLPVSGAFESPRSQITSKLLREGSVTDYEMIFKTKTGNSIPVLFSGAVMRNKEGKPEGIVGIAKDITELKRALEELKDTQFQLYQSEKLKVVGRLASGVAHEVKNPLAIILQGVEFLSSNVAEDDKDSAAVLMDIKNAVHRADSVIKGVLDYSSLSDLEIEPRDINSIIDATLLLIKHEFNQRKIEVDQKLKTDIPYVKVDKNKIEQVFVNLILNSVQSMSKGGKISISSTSKVVSEKDNTLDTETRDYFGIGNEIVIIEISDTGSGIAQDLIDRIFDPFFTTKGSSGGTGLGLSIVKNIVEMHEGRIRIENKKEGGLRTVVILKGIYKRS